MSSISSRPVRFQSDASHVMNAPLAPLQRPVKLDSLENRTMSSEPRFGHWFEWIPPVTRSSSPTATSFGLVGSLRASRSMIGLDDVRIIPGATSFTSCALSAGMPLPQFPTIFGSVGFRRSTIVPVDEYEYLQLRMQSDVWPPPPASVAISVG